MFYQIIRFVERDVDGCGTDIENMIWIWIDRYLTEKDTNKLYDTIQAIKDECATDGWDTDYLLEEAMTRCFGEEATWGTVFADIEVEY